MKAKYLIIPLLAIASLAVATWDNNKPGDNQVWNTAAGSIRDNWDAIEVELGIDLNLAHPYFQADEPALKPDQSTALDANDNGRLWIDSDDNNIYILTAFAGPTWTSAAAADNVTGSDASFTLQNTDEEDSDGGRQSRFVSKGEQESSAISTLGYIEFSHDGTDDDQKGKFALKLNDGDDDNAPSKAAITYLSTGKIDTSASLSVLDEDDLGAGGSDDSVVPTQQSVKAYVDSVTTMVPAVTGAGTGYGGEGSVTLSNGLIMKWGVNEASPNTQMSKTITFSDTSAAFPTTIVFASITLTDSAADQNTLSSPYLRSWNASSLEIRRHNGEGHSFNWFAIGY